MTECQAVTTVKDNIVVRIVPVESVNEYVVARASVTFPDTYVDGMEDHDALVTAKKVFELMPVGMIAFEIIGVEADKEHGTTVALLTILTTDPKLRRKR